jgi:DNA-3-methyladenine glycosylase II
MDFKLHPRPPYNFDLMLHYLQRSDLESVDRVEDGVLRTLLRRDGRSLLVSLWNTGTVDQPCLAGNLGGEVHSDTDEEWICRQLERRFHLQDDAAAFYRQMKHEGELVPLLEKFYGLKPVGSGSLYEALTWAILGQQINIRFAYMLKKTLVELAGARLESEGETYYAFPDPAAVAALSYEDLTRQRFSRRKAEYLIDLARQVESGTVCLDPGAHWDAQVVLTQLTGIRGIGRWTAEYGLMRGLGHPDVLPAADIGLRNAVQSVYGLEQQPDEETVRRIGDGWTGWRSWVAFYLWFYLAYRRRFPDEGDKG